MAKTIQMTLDDRSLHQLDEAVQSLKMTRAAFLRQALQQALRQFQIGKLEEKQAQGYAKHPLVPGELEGWGLFFDALEMFPDDFMVDGRQQPTTQQVREGLDDRV